jgi:hypothetical protein
VKVRAHDAWEIGDVDMVTGSMEERSHYSPVPAQHLSPTCDASHAERQIEPHPLN